MKNFIYSKYNMFIDWIWDTLGKREIERCYIGHGRFLSRRVWEIKFLGKTYTRGYDDKFE